MQTMMAATMSEKDVAVIFSYSGATKDTIHIAEVAKRAGGQSDLRHPVRQITADGPCGRGAFECGQRGSPSGRFHVRRNLPAVSGGPDVHGILPAVF